MYIVYRECFRVDKKSIFIRSVRSTVCTSSYPISIHIFRGANNVSVGSVIFKDSLRNKGLDIENNATKIWQKPVFICDKYK